MSRKRKRYRPVTRVPPGDALTVLREEVEAHEQAMARLVEQAARAGATGEAIARTLGVSRMTLYRRYGAALRAGRV